jgi:hypothetical protein
MNLIIILAAILFVVALFNIKKIGSFIHAFTIWPWELLLDNKASTGNGAGMFGPILGLILVAGQLLVVIVGVILWLIFG